MDLASIKTNTAAVAGGAWVDGIPGMGDLRLRVRGTEAFAYRDVLARLSRAVPRGELTEDGRLPAAVNDRVTGQALAEAVLLEWENVKLNGVDMPYSKDQAIKFLTDPDFGRFYEAVLWSAAKVNAAAAQTEETIAGNSSGG